MLSTQLSSRFLLVGAARRISSQTSTKQVARTLGRRQYANGADGAAQAASASSKLPWILSATALTAGGTYFILGPGTTSNQTPSSQPNTSSSTTSTQAQKSQAQEKIEKDAGGKRDWYADDHPKPVEDRHGDSVKKHSIAAEKNEYKIRHGVFSDKKFDNHIQKREGSPAEEFEEVQEGNEGGKSGKSGK
ncbi:hypothetical protein FB567DRAFT_535982 [Paraphoma chrysanthemicola]|uniref:Uncharacterized protein n=1 Tax=Paraphoma chrysanthemicola TaxID=798071 RepID=A0A8K0QWN2_9PLEO|nr:hypothetical protein FB567DRAFT_535982 [Paraphoma chrysanthemicola]